MRFLEENRPGVNGSHNRIEKEGSKGRTRGAWVPGVEAESQGDGVGWQDWLMGASGRFRSI